MLRQLVFRPEGQPISSAPRPDPFRRQGQARVVLVTQGTPQEMVYECLDRLEARELLGVKERTVLVKPNVVTGSPAPTTTSPEVVKAVCQWLLESGSAASGSRGRFNTPGSSDWESTDQKISIWKFSNQPLPQAIFRLASGRCNSSLNNDVASEVPYATRPCRAT